MALHKFPNVNVEVARKDIGGIAGFFLHRVQGVYVTCFSGGTWRPWWCLWLCTANATRQVTRLSVTCTTRNWDGSTTTRTETCTNCDGLAVNTVWAWGFNPPQIASSYSYSGFVEVDGERFNFSGGEIYPPGQAPAPR
jgi:hypothetical protein